MAESTDPLVLALADMPDVVRALLRAHRCSSSGHCLACGMPGTGSPYLRFPCSLFGIASRAQAIRRARTEAAQEVLDQIALQRALPAGRDG